MTAFADGSPNPKWIGDRQYRYCEEKEDDCLIVQTQPLMLAGVELVGTFAWKRRK